jgi:hypothetical protein
MKNLWIALVSLPAVLSADTAQDRGKRIVDDALTALGGEKFLAMRDRVETGRVYSFYREELSGLARARIYTRYISQPPEPGGIAQRERQSFGKNKEEYAVLFTEKEGWNITFRGARPLPAATLARYRDSVPRNILYILRMRLKEPGLMFEHKGSEIWSNQHVDLVDIIDADNRVVTVYFNKSTKLPVRQVYYRRDSDTKERMEEVTVFSVYRDIGGGVQWPSQMRRERNGEKVYEIFAESVAVNQGLTDDLFTLPGDMKLLKEKR